MNFETENAFNSNSGKQKNDRNFNLRIPSISFVIRALKIITLLVCID